RRDAGGRRRDRGRGAGPDGAAAGRRRRPGRGGGGGAHVAARRAERPVVPGGAGHERGHRLGAVRRAQLAAPAVRGGGTAPRAGVDRDRLRAGLRRAGGAAAAGRPVHRRAGPQARDGARQRPGHRQHAAARGVGDRPGVRGGDGAVRGRVGVPRRRAGGGGRRHGARRAQRQRGGCVPDGVRLRRDRRPAGRRLVRRLRLVRGGLGIGRGRAGPRAAGLGDHAEPDAARPHATGSAAV
ncbi:MAG: hypothetical protein AVDCRST_MAG41-3114, partial [uncultured Corynebacteriales bacterium]